jgi:predicted house-cleaning noncanonical NTP pyrophosphatase (MazG superfamily)
MANKFLRDTILEVIENQIRENKPAVVRETLERLMRSGQTRDEAMRLIGSALIEEISAVLNSQQPYDEARYRMALEKLR